MSNSGLMAGMVLGGNKGQVIKVALDKTYFLSPNDMGTFFTVTNTNGNMVRLPDATQLTKGAKQIIIQNPTTANLFVLDNSGATLKVIIPNTSCVFWCTDTTTSAGIWALTGTSLNQNPIFLMPINAYHLTSGNANEFSITALSATAIVVSWIVSGTTLMAMIIQLEGNSAITTGTVYTIASNTYMFLSVVALSATSIVFAYDNTANSETVIPAVISGTSISVGSQVAVPSSGNGNLRMAKLSATQAILQWESTSSYLCVLSVSGTSASFNALYTFATTLQGEPYFGRKNICVLTSTQFIAFGVTNQGTSSVQNAYLFSVSGTSITLQSTTLLTAADATGYTTGAAIALDATHVLWFCIYPTMSNSMVRILTISGTTVSLGTATSALGASVRNVSLAKITPNFVIGTSQISGSLIYRQYYTINAAFTSITLQANTSFNANVYPGLSLDSCQVSNLMGASVYYDTGTNVSIETVTLF